MSNLLAARGKAALFAFRSSYFPIIDSSFPTHVFLVLLIFLVIKATMNHNHSLHSDPIDEHMNTTQPLSSCSFTRCKSTLIYKVMYI